MNTDADCFWRTPYCRVGFNGHKIIPNPKRPDDKERVQGGTEYDGLNSFECHLICFWKPATYDSIIIYVK